MKVARTVREQVIDCEIGNRVSSLMIGAPDMAFVRCLALSLFCLDCNRLILLEWMEHTVLSLGGNLKTNIACTEKAKRFPT